MSDSREQSYYEIALTNKQVMTVFVVLLVCVLVAFLGGVWVGRGNSASVATSEPEAIASGVEPGEPALQELDFFSEEASAASEAEVASPEGVDRESVAAEAEAESAQPVIIEEIGARESAPRATDTSVSGPPAVADSMPPATSPAPTRAPARTPSAAVPGAEALVVQVFSSTDRGQAQRILERVRSGGYPAALSSGDIDGKPIYRVRVGPYSDRDEAQGVADRIRRAYKLDTWITR